MTTVLFLPLLQLPSGHHRVAEALAEGLRSIDRAVKCEKIELLSSRLGAKEQWISRLYLRCIRHVPKAYSIAYRRSVLHPSSKPPSFPPYEWLFGGHLKQLIRRLTPALIVCTHAFPSYLLDLLKQRGEIDVPVVNVYTDYFVHNLWGKTAIDVHFVGHPAMKAKLEEKGVTSERIVVTGIPVHPAFSVRSAAPAARSRYTGLISGGSLGLGDWERLLSKIAPDDPVDYYVLCGTNEQLYERLKKKNHPRLLPLRYISSPAAMSALYDEVDFVLTKPGGVTLSECLCKRKPAFIYAMLPGQEEINFRLLCDDGLVFDFRHWRSLPSLSEAIISMLHSPTLVRCLAKMDDYHRALSPADPALVIYERFLAAVPSRQKS
ncbi:MGDG synthase family glycosyltransferase [Geobacillus thermodenitrificans]|uniref:MGDG synthase family glycosyltransferase n=1 Tax=Geobacillus thermodenitrificans TaxID=33940 RepID=UPI000D39E9E2|nr:galactosyldiacylglycerol synthase [Geobacillus thermodenitrificans]MEC5186807.1 UDP-N-acetylglucosamine:LPS N-acetylglucosamine transferase [Geobacillus thermodenitrificans]PTR45874.1 galactosyldiacylglycerol synthase [Geobacillus thermodenitrificans]